MARTPVHQHLQPCGESSDQGVHPDLGIGPMHLDALTCAGMGPEEIWNQFADGFRLRIHFRSAGQARRHVVAVLPPGLDVAEGQLAGFVESDPVVNDLTQRSIDPFGIAGEQFGKFLTDHSTVIPLQPDRPDEVVEGDHYLHPPITDELRELSVMGESMLIVDPGRGLDPRPSDGEAEQLATHLRRSRDVLLVPIPEVRSPSTGGEPLAPLPQVPDVLPLWIMRFHLMIGVRSSKEESRREWHAPELTESAGMAKPGIPRDMDVTRRTGASSRYSPRPKSQKELQRDSRQRGPLDQPHIFMLTFW